jgi:TonB family protein
MESSGPAARLRTDAYREIPVPKFLVELEPRIPAFFSNLGAVLFPGRAAPLWITSKPGVFWPDVFINDKLPWRGLVDSVTGHVLVMTLIFTLTYFGYFGSRPQQIQNPLHKTISYYSIDDYLPELNSGSRPSKVELKGQPAYAKQEIISVPPEPDNTRQTIVTPSDIKLKHDVAMPNIVAWNRSLPSAPISATPGRKIKLAPLPEVVAPAPEPVTREGAIHMPSELIQATAVPPAVDPLTNRRNTQGVQPDVVAPAADSLLARRRDTSSLQTDPHVVEPAADILRKRTDVRVAVASAVEPAADVNAAKRPAGAMNIARMGPDIAAPKLPTPEQRALGPGDAAGGSATRAPEAGGSAGKPAGGGAQTAASAPPSPSIEGLGNGHSSGQLIALSVDPVEVKGPIEIPGGSRSGIFAAGPTGKPGAPGTPDVHKGSDGAGGNSTSKGTGPGSGTNTAPAGIYVGPGSTQTPAGAVVANKPGSPPNSTEPSFRDKLMAAARTPDIGRQSAPGSTVDRPNPIEQKVFGSKRYYSLTLNMPNLSSTTGSWIIRFAELKQSHDDVAIAAPAVLKKVDPAYPAELIRDKVEGTVILYAIIHSDGSIGEIKVLSSLEEKLDESAAKALARWKFAPGMKNGQAIDLEAVVQIPFKVRKMAF